MPRFRPELASLRSAALVAALLDASALTPTAAPAQSSGAVLPLPDGEKAAAPRLPASEERAELERLARRRYLEGDHAAAVELYLELARSEPEGAERAGHLLTAAWLQHLLGRQREALEALAAALAADPEYPFEPGLYSPEFEELFERARQRLGEQRRRRAAAQVTEALRQLEAGRPEEARRQLGAALQLDPEDPVALYNLAYLELREGRDEAAQHLLERLLAVSGASPATRPEIRLQGLTALGQLHLRHQRWIPAQTAYTAALELDPGSPELLTRLGLARLRGGDPEGAVDALRSARRQHPGDLEIDRLLSRALLEGERWAEAAAVARQSVESAPDDGEQWSLLALALRELGDLAGAKVAFRRAFELLPDRADLVNNLGGVHLAAGEYAEAEQAFVQALTLDPGLGAARENLALARAALDEAPPAPRTESPPPDRRRRSRPVPPKKIGLKFAELDYERLRLRGALVKQVTRKSPAARAGLRKGDLLLRLGDYELESAKDFFQYLRRNPQSGDLEVELLRDGSTRTLLMDLGG